MVPFGAAWYRCRILKRGGEIVSMGVVTEGLCSNVSLKTIQNKMQ